MRELKKFFKGYKKQYIVLFVILCYGLLIYLRMDPFMRTMFKYRILSFNSELLEGKREGRVADILNILLLLLVPFLSNSSIYSKLGGKTYNYYIGYFYPELDIELYSKLFWYDEFISYGINTPSIILYNDNNNITRLHPYDMNKQYIYKPIYGGFGRGIEVIKGDRIKDIVENDKDNYIIQDYLYDCTYKKAKHFRYISLYTGEKVSLYELKQHDKNKVTSNRGSGGEFNICNDFVCNSLDKNQKYHLDTIINKLNNFHKNRYPQIFVLSWDLMLDCEIIESVTAFCLEGNIISPLHWDRSNEFILDLKTKAEQFYIDNGYL
tara:strand:- start:134 stop:1099 length:966 start_codon:yes stop_codon:yes gene_type:complete